MSFYSYFIIAVAALPAIAGMITIAISIADDLNHNQ
jgi:hypothetical protein